MEKLDPSKGYWNPQRKLGVAFIFFEIIIIEFLTAEVSIFLKEKEKNISSQIFPDFAFTCRKLYTLIF